MESLGRPAGVKHMPSAHLYIFSDACPTDWLIDGHDDEWHTIVNLVFQSDPALQSLVDQGESHEAVLDRDTKYAELNSKQGYHRASCESGAQARDIDLGSAAPSRRLFKTIARSCPPVRFKRRPYVTQSRLC